MSDLQRISDTPRWPLKSYLPMKRIVDGEPPAIGYLIPGDLTTVRRQDAPDERYDSIEAMEADGWKVD